MKDWWDNNSVIIYWVVYTVWINFFPDTGPYVPGATRSGLEFNVNSPLHDILRILIPSVWLGLIIFIKMLGKDK